MHFFSQFHHHDHDQTVIKLPFYLQSHLNNYPIYLPFPASKRYMYPEPIHILANTCSSL